MDVYTGPGCQQCKMTTRKFNDAGVPFIEHDVTKDPQARPFLEKQGFTRLPVVVTDSDSWEGLQPDKINDAITRERAKTAPPAPSGPELSR